MSFKFSKLKPVVMLILISVSLPLQTISAYAFQDTASPSAEFLLPDNPPSTLLAQTPDSTATSSADSNVDPSANDINTGDAQASLQAENIVNTTVIDTSADASSSSGLSDSELSGLQADDFRLTAICGELNSLISDLNIEVNNQTSINQVLNLLADSGHNTVSTGNIKTGDADGEIRLVQQINTTLIGSCWAYLDKSIFEETSENIYLPYEVDILNKAQGNGSSNSSSQQSPQLQTTDISINNDVANDQAINQETNTGDNSVGSGEIRTGNSSSDTQIIDSINKNIIGNNWLYIEIVNPYLWSGEIVGQNLEFVKTDDVWYYWEWFGDSDATDNGATSSTPQDRPDLTNISINNQGSIDTQINSTVNTGGNGVTGSGSVETGDATSIIKIRNNINTSIIGDNWYYVSINLFAPFSGNLVFERADLIVKILSDNLKLKPHDVVELPISYQNTGQVKAKNTQLFIDLPPQLELLSPGNVTQNGQIVTINLGDVIPGQTGVITLKFKVKDLDYKTNLQLLAWLGSNTLEFNLLNNKSLIGLLIEGRRVSGGETAELSEVVGEENLETESTLEEVADSSGVLSKVFGTSFGTPALSMLAPLAFAGDDVSSVADWENACLVGDFEGRLNSRAQHLFLSEFQLWFLAFWQWLRSLIS